MSTHNYLDKTGLGQVWEKIKDRIDDNIVQSDWEENDNTKSAYIENRTHYVENIGRTPALDLTDFYWGNINYYPIDFTNVIGKTYQYTTYQYGEPFYLADHFSFFPTNTMEDLNLEATTTTATIFGESVSLIAYHDENDINGMLYYNDDYCFLISIDQYSSNPGLTIYVHTNIAPGSYENSDVLFNVPLANDALIYHTLNDNYLNGRLIRSGSGISSEIFNYREPYDDGNGYIINENNVASGHFSHAEGKQTTASGEASHAEGWLTTAQGSNSHAECSSSRATGNASHAEGSGTTASGVCSHSEGSSSKASGGYSHAEGQDTLAKGVASHAEGGYTSSYSSDRYIILSGAAKAKTLTVNSLYYEGLTESSTINLIGMIISTCTVVDQTVNNGVIDTITTSDYISSTAITEKKYTLGRGTSATANNAHSEGFLTFASGVSSHSEGSFTASKGGTSHSEGYGTIASSDYQHVQGKFNIEDANNTYADIVGNGTTSSRSNAYTLDWNGNGVYAGKVTIGTSPTNDMDVTTKKYVDDATASITDEKLSTGTIGSNVYYPIVGTNTASATTKYIDSTGFKYDATSSTNGYARLYLGNGTASGTEGSKYGRLMIYGTTAYAVTLDSGSPTENRTISLPNKNGTVALTSDVPTKVSDLTNDSGFITSYTETDPVFAASPAHGITSSDISNWNGKTSLALGITSSTAYRGDYGDAAYKHAVTNKGSAFTSGLYKITTNSEGHVTGATAVAKSDITGLGIPAQDTTYTFDGTYNASSNKAATVSTVTNAISALDGAITGAAGSGKTLTAFSQTDGKVTATFGNISITKSQISDFPTLGTAAAKNVTDNSTNTAVTNSDTNLITGRTLYYHLANAGYTTNTGTVTKITAGTGLSGGDITTSGTINHSNSVTAGTAGTSSATSGATLAVPYVTYDGQGHITASGTHTHTINAIPQASVTWGGNSLSADCTPDEVATIDDLGHNKFAFMSAASVEVHYSRNGGSTWTAMGTEGERRALVTMYQSFGIGGNAGTSATVNDQLRVQLNSNIAGGNIYCNLRRILLYVGTNGSGGSTCTVQYRTIANYNNNVDTWTTTGTYDIAGWSGWNSIPFSGAFGGSSTQTSQIAQIRLIFKVTSVSTTYTNLAITGIRGIAFPLWQSPSDMATTGHLYTYDIGQNAMFPAQVSATTFNGNVIGNLTGTSDNTKKILDAYNNNEITVQYAGASLSSASYFAAFDGYAIKSINTTNVRTSIGAAGLAENNTFSGSNTFSATAGFTYSGIEAGTGNADRCVWFADSSFVGRPVYDNDFKYNPATNLLNVKNISTSNIATNTINTDELITGSLIVNGDARFVNEIQGVTTGNAKAIMIVNINYSSNTYSADKTNAEIYNWYSVGGTVIARYNSEICYLDTSPTIENVFFSNVTLDTDGDTAAAWGTYIQIYQNTVTLHSPNAWIPVGSSSTDGNPKPLGTASRGDGLNYARADHVHPLPTLSISNNTITLTGATGSTSSISLPVYDGGVS